MQGTRMNRSEWLLLMLLSIIWGSTFFFAEIALRELPPLTLVAVRLFFAALLLQVLLPFCGLSLPRSGRLWGSFLVMGILNNMIPFSLLFWGQTRIDSGPAAILVATTPLFSICLAHFFLSDERFSLNRLAGVLCGIAGVTVMMGPEVLRGGEILAQFAVLGTSCSYGFASVYGRRFAALPPLVSATGQLTCSALMMSLIALGLEQPWRLSPPSALTWGAVLSLALVCSSAAYVIFFWIMARAGGTNVMLVTLLTPVVAILLGGWVLKEQLSAGQLGGMALIGLGLLVIDGRPLALLRQSLAPSQR